MRYSIVASVRLKFVQQFIANGTAYFYFRRPGCQRVRLKGLPGSEEFMASYQAALAASEPHKNIGVERNAHGTVAALIGLYADTADFKFGIAASTKEARWRILNHFRDEHGTKRVALLRREHIAAILNGRPPFAQRNWLDVLRPLLEFAVSIGWTKENPTQGIKVRRPKKGIGFQPWGPTQIERFRAHYQISSRERLALELLLGTMQRRSDIIRMGPQHVRDGMLHVVQQKTGVKLDIPVVGELQAAIDAMAGPRHLTFLVTAHGTPFDAASFGNWFRKACDAANLQGYSSHGLRKAGMVRLAHAGCTPHQIKAWSGHKTLAEVNHYTESVSQVALAREALDKVRAQDCQNAEDQVSKTRKSPPCPT
jgi:integrase